MLQIPKIGFFRSVVMARAWGNTWYFGNIRYSAAYLEGRPLPGQHNNVAIGAHSELVRRAPGPFYDLDKLDIDDEIHVFYKDHDYRYKVTKIWITTPDDGSPIDQMDTETLTLFTCSAYNPVGDKYDKRLIVRARYAPLPERE